VKYLLKICNVVVITRVVNNLTRS